MNQGRPGGGRWGDGAAAAACEWWHGMAWRGPGAAEPRKEPRGGWNGGGGMTAKRRARRCGRVPRDGTGDAKAVAAETFHCAGLSLRTGYAVVWDG